MGWLTHKTLEADRAEWRARLSAEREELVGSVLWQIDTELTPILAQEAARPHFVYSSFYSVPAVVVPKAEPGKTSTGEAPAPPPAKAAKPGAWVVDQQLPSPLLTQPSPYVLLHFQIDSNNHITSPQTPAKIELAVENGATRTNIDSSNVRMLALNDVLKYDQLVTLLSGERLPVVAINQWQLNNNSDVQVAGNTLDDPRVQQQFEEANQVQQPVAAPQQGAYQFENINAPYLANNGRNTSRAGNDLQQRNRAYQQAAQKQVVEQRLNYNTIKPELKLVSEGVSQPLWLGDRLILARRVKVGDDEVVQGCWLDWPKIRTELTERYSAELPQLDLQPVFRDTDPRQIKVSRLLATLPVQLKLPEQTDVQRPWSPLRMALVIAWSMLGLATVAVALLLQGVITLSERRGAFVAAVTHELRTPLTTFRMYAEMLAENMVPSAETRQKYLETLRIEADRLSHLVENVLVYARLERGRQGQRREPVTLGSLVERSLSRYADRAAQAGMKLEFEQDESLADVQLRTDPSAVEQILFNLVDNACKYAVMAADRRIQIALASDGQQAIIRVADHGPGIDAKAARRLFQPFSKSVHDAACSAPGVGLGLALSRRLAHQLGGKLVLESSADGARFALYLPVARH
jgi:signal transduction histidine kinase